MKRMNRMGLIIAATAISAVALAQTAVTPARSAVEAKSVIEARQNLFKDVKKAFDPMTAMLKRQREFDAALIATNAVLIQQAAQKMPAHFTVDTTAFKDIKTEAQDGIWKSQADFKAKSDALAKAAENLAAVAKGGDRGATTKAIADTGKSCGACHDSYKIS